MKPCITIIVLILLATRVTAGEIPNDFLKSDKPEWQAYFKRYLVFPETHLTLDSFVTCLKIPHVTTCFFVPVTGSMTNMISLSATNLLPIEALWELKQQTTCGIEIWDKCYGTLYITFGNKNY